MQTSWRSSDGSRTVARLGSTRVPPFSANSARKHLLGTNEGDYSLLFRRQQVLEAMLSEIVKYLIRHCDLVSSPCWCHDWAALRTSPINHLLFFGGGIQQMDQSCIQNCKLHDFPIILFSFFFFKSFWVHSYKHSPWNDSTGSAPSADRTSRSTHHTDLPPRRTPFTKGGRQRMRRRHAGINRMTRPNKRAFTGVTMECEKSRLATKRMRNNQSRFETTSISLFHTLLSWNDHESDVFLFFFLINHEKSKQTSKTVERIWKSEAEEENQEDEAGTSIISFSPCLLSNWRISCPLWKVIAQV